MATILLSAVGGAIGASLGGGILGLSSVVIGRAIGATVGRAIDQAVMGPGAQTVEHGKLDRLRLTTAGEGTPIPRVWGRMRVPAHVLWASEFKETITSGSGGGSGKGGRRQPKIRQYSYSISLALGLCEGPIAGIGRIWADGQEIQPDEIDMRVYEGTEDQLPDPLIEASKGEDQVPAYRGLAYVVMENLQLGDFGNRVPQFSFEVIRNDADGALSRTVTGVAMMPGTGEYALATTPVRYARQPGEGGYVNVSALTAETDFTASLRALQTELPNVHTTSLIVSWFGDDLRVGACRLKPKVEDSTRDGIEMPWSSGGIYRSQAEDIPRDADGRAIYGGTPADTSVLEAITAMRAAGQEVMFYPFILMEQQAGNGLPDPWGGAEQARLPWRGRITTALAPGRPGTTDGTAAADAEVAAFFGTAQPNDFFVVPYTDGTYDSASTHEYVINPGTPKLKNIFGRGALRSDHVTYVGPDEWSYRRFILHYAHLCAAAGGVESFCIGSEMRGLTQIRGASGFPAVDALRQLAADVAAILPDAKISYAADWSEYFGYSPQDGSGDLFFHLDPLWADPNIHFVGIDNYMPLSDWRDGADHADAHWPRLYDLDYLKSNILGGEGYDWYYASAEARDLQIRTPITDGAHGEPWVYRYKDLPNWWGNTHHERIGGARSVQPTDWVAGMKPIRFTELGCAAVDKATNQPNRFLDPKSSESGLPYYSDGRRDDLIQLQYHRAMHDFWTDPANNPASSAYGGPMLDTERAYAWAWDARPFPQFPGLPDKWSDAVNHARGHWLTGRSGHRTLSSVVHEICARAGVTDIDTDDLTRTLRGYGVTEIGDARAALQPLMLAYGFDAIERDGRLIFRTRRAAPAVPVDPACVVAQDEGDIQTTRAPQAEETGRVSLGFVDSGGDFTAATAEAQVPDVANPALSRTEINLVLSQGDARAIAQRWLSEARIARDTLRLALPPSAHPVGAGDTLSLDGRAYRIDRVELGDFATLEATRVEPDVYLPVDVPDTTGETRIGSVSSAPPVLAQFLDLPLLRGDEVPHAPHIAAASDPWPGEVALMSSVEDAGYALNTLIPQPATVGVTLTDLHAADPSRIDRGAPLNVSLLTGTLSSVGDLSLLAGANAVAIGSGEDDIWEVLQFRDAALTGPRSYALTHRLRGQAGTDGIMPAVWPTGSSIVLLNAALPQITLPRNARSLPRHYRIGPSSRAMDAPTWQHAEIGFRGIGLRPYAVAHLRVEKAGDDLSLNWTRRTRIDGDPWENADVPLGEDVERYEVTVSQAGVVKRRLTVGAPQWTYDAAQRTSDGPGCTVSVAQVSTVFGPGPARSLSVPDP